MAKSRTGPWLAVILVPVALLAVAIPGMFVYMKSTAKPLHPNIDEIPSVGDSAPATKLTSALERSRQLVRETISKENWPGLSVAVGRGGEIVWAEGFGHSDLENRVPVTPKHRFRIGTASTVLTSAAAGLLIEKGQLKLEEPIQTYVSTFPQKKWPVTVRQLMAHTSGIKNDGGDEGPLYSEHCERPVEALQHFADGELLFDPGTEYRYSSYGWIVVSAAIETVSKKPFLAIMKEQVFDPLGMGDTVADSLTQKIPDRATFYFPRFAADPKYGPDLMRDVDYSCYAGSSVFLSTPSDLVRFGMAIQNGRLLRRETVKLMQTSERLTSGKETGYGLGWDLETVTIAGQQTPVVGHDGTQLGGMLASLMTFPAQGIVVSVISNISYADTFSLGTKIAEAFTNQDTPPARR